VLLLSSLVFGFVLTTRYCAYLFLVG
jgi:hypothetical protein